MINTQEVMEEIDGIEKAIENMDVVSKILKIKGYFEETPIEQWQMDRVTDYMLILCNLMYNLTDLKDYAYIKAESLSEEYKSAVRDAYLRIKKSEFKVTDGLAKAMAEQECDEIKRQELKAIYQARKIKSLYDDSDRLVSYSQTKVKSISDSVVRSKIERK
jgi:hypothetical protein